MVSCLGLGKNVWLTMGVSKLGEVGAEEGEADWHESMRRSVSQGIDRLARWLV